jgi:hypothetical protein
VATSTQRLGKSGRKKVKTEDGETDGMKDEEEDHDNVSKLTDDLSVLEGEDAEDIKVEEE